MGNIGKLTHNKFKLKYKANEIISLYQFYCTSTAVEWKKYQIRMKPKRGGRRKIRIWPEDEDTYI